MKKQLSLLFTLLLAGQALLSCGEAADDTETVTTADAGTVTETAVVTEEPREYANLPEKDFGGAEAKIFLAYNIETGTTNFGVSKNEFGASEENGDAVNDARYKRNTTIEDTCNVKLVSYDYNEVNNLMTYVHDSARKEVSKLIMAGDNDYAFMLLPGYSVCNLAEEGYLQDLYSMPNLDLTRAWWDQKANADLTITNRLFFTTGDISTADNDATCTVFFNKNIAEEYDLPDLYQMVLDGKWTLDQFYTLCADVSKDINGDGKYDENDRYGAMIWDDITMAVVNSTGAKCASTDTSGNVILTLNDERVVNVLDSFIEFGRDTAQCYQYQRAVDASDTVAIQLFTANQNLFFMQLMQMVPKLRDMEADFGIIPFPKYDETQDSYYNTVGSWHSVFFCMPMSTADQEMSTILAEALACESKYTVTEAYYDVNLKTKAARDEESAAMLDIIFETRVYDLGWYYQFGGYNEAVMNLFRLNQPAKEFTSMYEKNEKKALKNIEKLNETFASLDLE
ncbi:MAG: hypothetical protein IJ449_11080 [Clostridia bacterium]|nr:hypothetical protein [Clostridia bacterium]